MEDKSKIITEVPPLDSKGNPKRKFEVKMRALGSDPQKDGVEKAVFIDGNKIDFKIDVIRFLEAKRKGMDFLIEEQKRIEKDFVKSVSDAIGRRITSQDIKRAILEGWI
jgi:hypothetical protein